ncbi:MAG: DUF6268 family outer membrane beta-barrel protein [Phycisphaerales bacterium JB037]
MMRKTMRHATMMLLVSAGMASAQPAQGGGEPDGTLITDEGERVAARSRLGVSITGRSVYAFPSGLDGGGDLSVTRLGADVAVSGAIDDRNRLIASFNNEFSFYDLSGTALIPGDSDGLLEETYDSGVGLAWISQIDDAWSVLVRGSVDAAGESGADFGDSLTYGGLVVVSNQITPNLRLGAGVIARTRLEDDALVVPIVAIDWIVADGWTVTTGGASGGAGIEVRYELTEEVTLTLAGGWRSDDYRLSDDNPLPDGVVRHDRVPVAAGVIYRPSRRIEIVARGGAHVWQRLEVLDGSGDEIADANGDAAPFISLDLSFRF